MVDDQMNLHPKPTGLIDAHGSAGLAALGLWTMAGSQTQAKYQDGLVLATDLHRLTLDRKLALKLAGILVDAGLWHAAGHDCDRCAEVSAGNYRFHDWFDVGYEPGVKVKQTRARRKELRDPKLIEAVWARDQGHCRYCNRKLNRGDKKSTHRPTIDHVIPSMAAGVTNLVLACLECNQRKAQRTPEQAGMPLLPPPVPPDGSGPESTLISDRSTPDRKVIPAIPQRDKAKDGHRSRSGTEQVAREGPAGEAPALDVPGRFGSPHFGPGYSGSDDGVARCQVHDLEVPCHKCTAASYAEEIAS